MRPDVIMGGSHRIARLYHFVLHVRTVPAWREQERTTMQIVISIALALAIVLPALAEAGTSYTTRNPAASRLRAAPAAK